MPPTLYVALGSALGGVARHWAAVLAARLWGDAFPWGTILINVTGSFVIGFVATLTVPDGAMPASVNARTFVMVGLCGGFTTFSSFSLQTLALARNAGWLAAAGNVTLSVAACLVAVTIGHLAAERVPPLRAAGASSRDAVAALDPTGAGRYGAPDGELDLDLGGDTNAKGDRREGNSPAG